MKAIPWKLKSAKDSRNGRKGATTNHRDQIWDPRMLLYRHQFVLEDAGNHVSRCAEERGWRTYVWIGHQISIAIQKYAELEGTGSDVLVTATAIAR